MSQHVADTDLTLRDEVAEVLAAHARKTVREPVPSLDIHCECGWTHPDRFISNPDIHRAHVADALLPLLARARAEAEARVRDRVEAVLSTGGNRDGTLSNASLRAIRAALTEATGEDT